MSRSTVRFAALIVLALLGAPVATHFITHDLHDHHAEAEVAGISDTGHGDHEHPIVTSLAPQLPDVTRVAAPLAIAPAATPATLSSIATTDRNVLSFGALRMDDDVGLQPLLSTFLI